MADVYVAVDLETTGLNPRTDRIIEIGAVRMEHGEAKAVYHQLINPERAIGAFVEQLTGITDDMVKGAPTIADVLPEFLAFAGEAPLVGHNLMFDYSFLKRNAVNAGASFERSGVDTLALVRMLLPELPKKSLPYVCEQLKIETGTSHRAVDDARAAAHLYEYVKENWRLERERLEPKPLFFRVKREAPATPRQKEYLRALMKYHKIDLDLEVESLTKNEASRRIDGIIGEYGKMYARVGTGMNGRAGSLAEGE